MQLDRDEIARLLEAAMPGPWRVCETTIHGKKYGGCWIEGPEVEDDDGRLHGMLIPITGSGGAMSYTTRLVDRQDHDHNDANAALIALAPALARAYVEAPGAGALAWETKWWAEAAYREGHESADGYWHKSEVFKSLEQASPTPADLQRALVLALPEVRALVDAADTAISRFLSIGHHDAADHLANALAALGGDA